MTESITASSGQYLRFQLGAETFACDILQIREILEYHRPTTVPQMPAFVHGVMNLRGSVVPVIDLAQRLGRAPGKVLRRSCIVILQHGAPAQPHPVGMLVDAVHEVIDLHPADIMPPPPFGNQLRADFIAGLAQCDGHCLMLLQMDKVLSLEEMAALARPAGLQIQADIRSVLN
ncbi:positive regulator of CheA protein activity CheW [Aquitalea magnusonii]|jgi:purine-binding chemotaxis protein CheW|uniref:Positive regulator of CheA protein activity CheW n=1 Tax=Aquitalea magnusonii TaxID=332411 RepID=A0A3G9G741_9NEIS|nr:chemotaxis protein CheW [Aquitalea magnusonii]BBF83890.1 positive regulator of CheA protein activity CheW [Aquitalea magnusonii]